MTRQPRKSVALAPAFVALAFILLVWVPTEAAFTRYCINNYDLGIYGQALQNLSLSNLNPWLSVREVKLFNDHLDPVLFLLLPFKHIHILGEHPGRILLRFEMIAALVTAGIFFWMARARVLSSAMAAFLAFFVLFNRAGLGALTYPAHPGTWSILPLALTCLFLWQQQWRAAITSFFFCLLCKEEYPVVGIAVAAALFLTGKRRPANWFLAMSIAWGILAFVIRPLVLGASGQYTGSVENAEGILYLTDPEKLKAVATWTLSWMLPLVPLWWAGLRDNGFHRHIVKRALPILAMIASLLAIRLAGGWWFSHRSIAPVTALAFATGLALPVKRAPRWLWPVAGLLLVATSWQAIRPSLRYWSGKDIAPHCPADAGRISSLDQATDRLLAEREGKALVQGNLIPRIVERDNIHHLGATTQDPASFRWLLVEKNGLGQAWPGTPEMLSETVRQWRASGDVQKIIDEPNVLLLERGSGTVTPHR
jgi:hypothetical protein